MALSLTRQITVDKVLAIIWNGGEMTKRRKRRLTGSGLPTPVWVAGLVGLVLVVAGLVFLTGQQDLNPTALPDPAVPRISPSEAYDQQQAGTGIIIDVRGTQFYQESHAAGAISLPEEELPAQIAQLPKDKSLILYCT
jgi:hypothetical protein